MRLPLDVPIALTAAGLVLGVAAIAPAPAATISFTVNTLSGPLAGESLPGFLSFNEAGFTGTGDEVFALETFSFEFLGTEFTAAADSAASFALQNGAVQGLDFIGPNFDFLDAEFNYALASGRGQGMVTYTLAAPQPPIDSSPASIPAAANGWGLLLFGGLALGIARSQQVEP